MKLVEFDAGEDEDKPAQPCQFTFTKDPSFAPFRRPATKVQIFVQRPSQNIVKEGMEFVDRIVDRSKALLASLRIDDRDLRFCDLCCSGNGGSEHLGAGVTVAEAARLCRAVIRRLCMDSYSAPFLYENHVSGKSTNTESSHDSCVSLCRLDRMMTCPQALILQYLS